MLDDLCFYSGPFHQGLAYFYDPVFGNEQYLVELQHLFLGSGQLLHLKGVPWVDCVLFAASLYYCVIHGQRRL